MSILHNRRSLFFGISIILFAIFISGFTTIKLIKEKSNENLLVTNATVTNIKKVGSSNKSDFQVHYQFKDLNGKKHIGYINRSSTSDRYAVGKTIEIIYDKTNPKISSENNTMFIFMAVAVMSIVLALIGIVCIIFRGYIEPFFENGLLYQLRRFIRY